MALLHEILEFNRTFVENREYEDLRTTKFPNKKMVILTCMDTRLIELLPRAMNLRNGDVKMIKNAGATVSHPFGSIMRSILVAVYQLNAREVAVIGHHDCGMIGLEADTVVEKARESGIPEETFQTLIRAGIPIKQWLTGFSSVEDNVTHSVQQIKQHPLFPAHIPVHGLVIHPETGKLDLVVDGYSME